MTTLASGRLTGAPRVNGRPADSCGHRRARHLLGEGGDGVVDVVPAVPPQEELLGGLRQTQPLPAVHQERDAGAGEGLGRVRDQDLPPSPAAPAVVDTTGMRWVKASRILMRVPPPDRSGAATRSARASSAVMSGTNPVTTTRGGAARRRSGSGAWPTRRTCAAGIRARISGAIRCTRSARSEEH